MKKADAILSADLHLREDKPVCRTDEYFEAQARKLKWLSDLQRKHDCPILDAGDLLNRHRISPHLEQYLIKNMPDQFITIPGNHDLPNHNLAMYDRSSLSVLEASGKVEVMKDTKGDWINPSGYEYSVYGIPYGQESRGFKMERLADPSIFLLHIMCYQGKPPYPGADKEGGTAISILKKYPDFDLIVTGHNHQSFVQEYKGRLLVNPGSMMRSTADQEDHRPCVYLWYAETNTVEPAYYPIEEGVISREHLDKVQERDERMEAFVEQLRTDTELGLSFEDNMERWLAANKLDKQVEELIMEAMGEN